MPPNGGEAGEVERHVPLNLLGHVREVDLIGNFQEALVKVRGNEIAEGSVLPAVLEEDSRP